MIENYDPNWRDGVHTLQITLQRWDYRGRVYVKVGGNCKGYWVMEDLPDILLDHDALKSDCKFRLLEDDDEWWRAVLRNKQGKELECEGDRDDLKESIVAVEIVDFLPSSTA